MYPKVPIANEAIGSHQSDIVIRTAIIAALADMRKNPWLLDYCFAGLPKDELTAQAYGEQEVAKAREWFLKTDIPVMMSTHINDIKMPCITIALASSSEDDQVFGDIHYEPFEELSDGRIVSLESTHYREVYHIGCHVQGESFELAYLHSIVHFALNRYKDAYLENRGFERSTMRSTDFVKNEYFDVELAYSRFIEITGYVMHVWPKNVSEAIEEVTLDIVGEKPDDDEDVDFFEPYRPDR